MKKLQNKILLIFLLIGITIIIGMGAFFGHILNQSNTSIGSSEYITSQELNQIINVQINQTKILILGTILVFSCIVCIIGIFISEVIVKPINKMINNAQKIASGESVELIEIRKSKRKKRRRKTEIDSITHIIGLMTGEMKQKLNDVNRQKREIEAILLHMNDGVLAFDEKGNVMHINPAAKTLLNIEEEKTFDEIFKRFNINMETIMYLDNWDERKINIGEKTVNIFFASYKDENDL